MFITKAYGQNPSARHALIQWYSRAALRFTLAGQTSSRRILAEGKIPDLGWLVIGSPHFWSVLMSSDTSFNGTRQFLSGASL